MPVDDVGGLAVKVEAADGQPVATRMPVASSTYTFGGRQGQSIQAFRIDKAGIYRVSADYDGGAGPKTVIAVGQGFMRGMFVLILSALGALFGGIVLSIVGRRLGGLGPTKDAASSLIRAKFDRYRPVGM